MIKFFKIISCLWLIIALIGCNDRSSYNDQPSTESTAIEALPQALTAIDHAVIISYTSAFDEEQSFSDYLSKNFSQLADLNVLNDANLKIQEKANIDKDALQELLHILYQEKCSDDLVGNCFTPNHAIIYYDAAGKVIGYTEICFECITTVSSSNIPEFKLCNAKLNLLMEYMKKHDIHYFEHVI